MLNSLLTSPRNGLTIPNVAKIDSFGVLIRESDLISYDYKLVTAPTIVYEETAETISDVLPVQPQIFVHHGIKLRFSRHHLNSNENFKGGYFIRVVITSKMLKDLYFVGLNIDNLDVVVQFINSTGIITINNDILLDSIVNDIDICKDFYMHDKNYSIFLPYLRNRVKQSKLHAVSMFKDKNDQDNTGLIFGESRNGGKWSNPYIKYYNKSAEIYGRSVEFYNQYLSPLVLSGKLELLDLKRYEVTIKNNEHKSKLVKQGIVTLKQFKTVRDLYNIPESQLRAVMLSYSSKYFVKRNNYKTSIEFSPTDNAIAYLIDLAIKKGSTKDEVYGLLDMSNNRQRKYEMKKRVDRIFNYVCDSAYVDEMVKQNAHFFQFIEFLDLKDFFQANYKPSGKTYNS